MRPAFRLASLRPLSLRPSFWVGALGFAAMLGVAAPRPAAAMTAPSPASIAAGTPDRSLIEVRHGGHRGGGFRGFHGGGGRVFHGGGARFYGGGARFAPVHYGYRPYYRPHRPYYRPYYRPRYYYGGPRYTYAPVYAYPRRCRVVWTYYGPRRICRPWVRHHHRWHRYGWHRPYGYHHHWRHHHWHHRHYW
jgi:hypothetical protein